jgi:hypothetical protein
MNLKHLVPGIFQTNRIAYQYSHQSSALAALIVNNVC